MADYSQNDISLGSIIRDWFSLRSRTLVLFVAAALLVKSLPLLNDLGVDLISQTPDSFPTGPVPRAVIEIIVAAFSYWLTVALILATVSELEGGRKSVASYFLQGLPVAFPVICVAAVYWIAVGLPALLFTAIVGPIALLLLIPGIFVGTIFYLAIPVAVVEKPGIIASFRRSATISKGHRWQLFRIIILVLFFWVIAMLLGWAAFRSLRLPVDPDFPFYIGSFKRAVVLGAFARLTSAVFLVIFPVVYTLVYHKLRTVNIDQTSTDI